jgi:hypothetical protein
MIYKRRKTETCLEILRGEVIEHQKKKTTGIWTKFHHTQVGIFYLSQIPWESAQTTMPQLPARHHQMSMYCL